MTKRVTKKLVGPLQDIDGAIIVVNAYDPQLATVKLFIEAVSDLPHFIVLNKTDMVKTTEAMDTVKNLGDEKIILASVLHGRGIRTIREEIHKLPKRIMIGGIFNAGKTSLINALTGESNPVDDIPGTTLEISEYPYEDKILLDTTGQIIDISKPLMVSIDLTECATMEDKLLRCLTEDIEGIKASLAPALPGLVKAVEVILRQVSRGYKIVTCGAGASALVAMEMAGQAQETGLPAMVFTNNFADCQPVAFAKGLGETEFALADYFSRAVQEGDVAIAVSASGGTGFTFTFLELVRKKGAITIAITENPDTPLGKVADIIIKSNAKPEGPCLHPETPVLSKKRGLMPIKSLQADEEILGIKINKSHKENVKYKQTKGQQIKALKWVKVKTISSNKVNSIFRVKTKGGGEIETTANHILFIRKSAGVFPKKVSELQVGEFLVDTFYNTPINTSTSDAKLLGLCGYYVAEGSLGTRSIIYTLSAKETELKDRIAELMCSEFNCSLPRIVTKHNGSAIDLWFSSTKAMNFFDRECGKGAHNKHIPSLLKPFDQEGLASFLKAYHQGDGDVTKDGKYRIRSVSEKLLLELAWLSRLCQIPCSISHFKQKQRMIRNEVLKASNIWQLQFGKNAWNKLIGNQATAEMYRQKITSIREENYQGKVYDIVDCEGNAFFAGKLPILSHNSSSKIQVAHLAIGHALILTLADLRGITAEESIQYMLPRITRGKKMGIK